MSCEGVRGRLSLFTEGGGEPPLDEETEAHLELGREEGRVEAGREPSAKTAGGSTMPSWTKGCGISLTTSLIVALFTLLLLLSMLLAALVLLLAAFLLLLLLFSSWKDSGAGGRG